MSKLLYFFYGSVFLQHLAYGVSIPVLIIWQFQNGLSFTQIGLLQSIGFAVVILSEIPSSYMADSIGRRFTSLIGLIFSLISFGILLFAHDFFTFAFSQIFLSLGLAFLSGTEETLLHDAVGEGDSKLTHYLGLMSVYDEMGTIVGMFSSTLFISFFDVSSSFLVGFIALLCAIVLIFFVKMPPVSLIDHDIQKKARLPFFGLSLIFIFLVFAFMAERGQMVFQSIFHIHGLNLENFGIIYVFAKIFSILGSSISHPLEKRFSSQMIFYFSAVAQMVAFGILLLQSIWIAIAALAIFSFAENIFRNVQKSLVLKLSNRNRRATNLSFISFSSSIFLILFQPLLGFSLDTGLLYAVILLIALKFLAFFLLFIKVRIL